jgi:hypothetical protein
MTEKKLTQTNDDFSDSRKYNLSGSLKKSNLKEKKVNYGNTYLYNSNQAPTTCGPFDNQYNNENDFYVK